MDIFVRGFFHINLGDDLFLYMLAKRYPQHKFHVILNSEYTSVFRDQDNIIIHSYHKIRRALDRILIKYGQDFYTTIEKKCQLNVVIGGSIFQEGENDFGAYERLAQMPCLNPTYILGANFGPYTTEKYRLLVQDYLSLAKDVCFRDKWSQEKFSELSNIRFAPDIVLGLNNIISFNKEVKKQVFISVIDYSRKPGVSEDKVTQYEQFILNCINYYSQLDYDVILSSFCKMEGDEEAIKRLRHKITDDINFSILNYTGDNWKELVNAIQNSMLVIASRFHAMILAGGARVPVFPIAYNKKFSQFLDDFNLSSYCISMEELVNKKPEKMDYFLFNNIEEISNNANKHFIKLDELLLGDGCENNERIYK